MQFRFFNKLIKIESLPVERYRVKCEIANEPHQVGNRWFRTVKEALNFAMHLTPEDIALFESDPDLEGVITIIDVWTNKEIDGFTVHFEPEVIKSKIVFNRISK